MSQRTQLVSKAIDIQRNALENSQQAVEQAVELPMKQSIEFQKNAGKLFLDGLEMTNWLQTRNAELTRDAFESYIDSVENVAENTTYWAERGLQEATDLGQQGLQSQQQLATSPDWNAPATGQHPAPPRQQAPGHSPSAPQDRRSQRSQPIQQPEPTQQSGPIQQSGSTHRSRQQPPSGRPPFEQPPSGQPPVQQPSQQPVQPSSVPQSAVDTGPSLRPRTAQQVQSPPAVTAPSQAASSPQFGDQGPPPEPNQSVGQQPAGQQPAQQPAGQQPAQQPTGQQPAQESAGQPSQLEPSTQQRVQGATESVSNGETEQSEIPVENA